jgi:glycosyltransferase involved in cell wall biosynthesis
LKSRSDLEVLLFNLRTDAADSVLGFTTTWLNALARRVAHVSVVTMYAGEIDVEPNVSVHSLGKERGLSEPRRVVEFYRLVQHVLSERPVDVCFSHMNPKFSILFAPVARARGIPQLLWFAHGSAGPSLRAAERLVDRCVTPTPASFRLRSDKLYVTGHGIDTSVFRPPTATGAEYRRTAVSVERISPVKRPLEMIEATAIVRERGHDLRLELVGAPLTSGDREYLEMLRRRTRELGLDASVTFSGRVPFREVAARYRRGALFLNLSETRSLDKAILEAMASGCVPVCRNESFAAIAREEGFAELVPGDGPAAVADRIVAELRRGPDERADLVARLRGVVEDHHSLDALIDTLAGHLGELAAAGHREAVAA